MTIEQWLKLVDHPLREKMLDYRAKYLVNAPEHHIMRIYRPLTYTDAINYAFDWSLTNEGHNFWLKVTHESLAISEQKLKFKI